MCSAVRAQMSGSAPVVIDKYLLNRLKRNALFVSGCMSASPDREDETAQTSGPFASIRSSAHDYKVSGPNEQIAFDSARCDSLSPRHYLAKRRSQR